MNRLEFLNELKEYCDYYLRAEAKNYQSQIYQGELQVQIDYGHSIYSSTVRIAEDDDRNIHIFLYSVTTIDNGMHENESRENYRFKFNQQGQLIDRSF